MKNWAKRNWSVFGLAVGVLFTVAGCLSPIALHRAVVEYDKATRQVEAEILLLNIARASYLEPLHFTAVSSVAATFDFVARAGFTPTGTEASPLIAPFFSATVAERPTITIIPVRGEEFTKRILTPLNAESVAFLFQAVETSVVLRLMAKEFVSVENKGLLVLRNDPRAKAQYIEFRRRVLHLSSLSQTHGLYVGPILYERVLPVAVPESTISPQMFREMLKARKEGFRWREIEKGKPLHLIKKITGRLAITNYDLSTLSNRERQQFDEQASLYTDNSVLVDIRPDGPGGDYSFRGYFLLRSFEDILRFVARGILAVPEFDVQKDPKTGPTRHNPTSTLTIDVTQGEPVDAVFKVEYAGSWYSIKRFVPQPGKAFSWDQQAFRTLKQLYQMTLTDISRTPSPAITIAK